jgi:hypothetical protein
MIPSLSTKDVNTHLADRGIGLLCNNSRLHDRIPSHNLFVECHGPFQGLEQITQYGKMFSDMYS